MFSMFAESAPTCGGFSITAGTIPASTCTAKNDALTGRGIFRFTPYEPRMSHHRFQHVYALFFYAMFSLDYVFVRDFECFFLPVPRISEARQAFSARIWRPFCGKGFLPHLHVDFAGVDPGQAAASGPWGLRAGPSHHRLTVVAGIPDNPHH